MKVIDTVNKTELELTAEELIDLVANHNRQVDLVFAEKRSDEDGYLSWDQENWTCVDGKRFIRSYFLAGRALSDYSGYNKYDLKGCFRRSLQRSKKAHCGVFRSAFFCYVGDQRAAPCSISWPAPAESASSAWAASSALPPRTER